MCCPVGLHGEAFRHGRICKKGKPTHPNRVTRADQDKKAQDIACKTGPIYSIQVDPDRKLYFLAATGLESLTITSS